MDHDDAPHVPRPADPSAPRQVELPFGEVDDRPIAFALTARARREVAPQALPSLAVVRRGGRDPAGRHPAALADDRDGGLDDPGDTRPARARALRRAGIPTDTIARQVGVDTLLVRAWIEGVSPAARDHTRHHLTRAATGTEAVAAPAVASTPVHAAPAGGLAPVEADPVDLAPLRARARATAAARLPREPHLHAGVAVLAACAEPHRGTLTLTHGDARVLAVALRWLRAVAEVSDDHVRVVLRLGPRAAGDLVAPRWARTLDLPSERVRTTRWATPPASDAVGALVRVVDATATAVAAGWCDALLDDRLDVADDTF